MSAFDLITIADLKEYSPIDGTGRDAVLARCVTAASRILETALGRRLVYRAPPEVVGAANIVADVVIANGAQIVAAQPAGPRTLVVTLTDADRSVTAGTVTVTGTVDGVAGQTEVFDLVDGAAQHGVRFFTAIASIDVASLAGATAADKLKVGSSLGYLDYHSVDDGICALASYEWPIRQTVEVNEDAGRAFGASTLLTAGTDYVVAHRDNGDFLVRISSSLPTTWGCGWRAVKHVYAGGWRVAEVPEELKEVCRRLALILYTEVSQRRIGISGMSDAMGNWTRFGPARLTREMREQVEALRRRRFGYDTAERDFDLEAA